MTRGLREREAGEEDSGDVCFGEAGRFHVGLGILRIHPMAALEQLVDSSLTRQALVFQMGAMMLC